jgi:hypothetical protein
MDVLGLAKGGSFDHYADIGECFFTKGPSQAIRRRNFIKRYKPFSSSKTSLKLKLYILERWANVVSAFDQTMGFGTNFEFCFFDIAVVADEFTTEISRTSDFNARPVI